MLSAWSKFPLYDCHLIMRIYMDAEMSGLNIRNLKWIPTYKIGNYELLLTLVWARVYFFGVRKEQHPTWLFHRFGQTIGGRWCSWSWCVHHKWLWPIGTHRKNIEKSSCCTDAAEASNDFAWQSNISKALPSIRPSSSRDRRTGMEPDKKRIHIYIGKSTKACITNDIWPWKPPLWWTTWKTWNAKPRRQTTARWLDPMLQDDEWTWRHRPEQLVRVRPRPARRKYTSPQGQQYSCRKMSTESSQELFCK